MFLTDPGGRVLVVKPTYKPRWELPGGGVEDDEPPAAAAEREVAEELGIQHRAGRLLALDHVPARNGRTEGLIVVFDGGSLAPSTPFRLPPDELSDWAFVEPDRLGNYLPPLQTRRARAALGARDRRETRYLENGAPR